MAHVRDLWHKKGPDGKLIESRYYGVGKRWQARWWTPDGAPKTKLFAKKVDAEKHITKMSHSLLAGDYLDPEAGKVTVRKYAYDFWLPAQGIIDRSWKEYEGALRRYLMPEWGEREMRTIKPSQAGAWQALLTSKYELSGGYPNRVARYARSVFKLAVIDKVIHASPFDGIKAPTLVESTVDPPDVAEVQLLMSHAYADLWKELIEVDALTGLRSGELRGMRVEKIDFLRKNYRVEEQLVYEAGRGLHFDDLKTGAGKRVIPLNDRALNVLAARIAKHPPPAEGPWKGLIFTMPGSKPVGESTIDWALKNICRKAGVRPRHMHEIRHHYASVLIAGKENPKVVQKRLGHKDVLTTLRIYAHLFNEAEEQTRDVLDDAWAPEVEKSAPRERLATVSKIT